MKLQLRVGIPLLFPSGVQSIPPASSSLFLAEDDLLPSNQLEVSQIVPETMLPSRPGAMILPEVTLPLNTLQANTAYSLLRTLRNFCSENPGVLDTTSELVQLPPVGDAQSPYQVPPSPPVWPVPQLPLRGLSLYGNLRNEQEEYAENVYVHHLINAATALANAARQDVGVGHAAIQDISVGFGVDRQRLNVVCTEAPGVVVFTDPAMDDEAEMDSVLDGNYGAKTLTHNNERIHYGDLKDRYRQRRDRSSAVHAEYSPKPESHGSPSSGKNVVKEDIRKFSKSSDVGAPGPILCSCGRTVNADDMPFHCLESILPHPPPQRHSRCYHRPAQLRRFLSHLHPLRLPQGAPRPFSHRRHQFPLSPGRCRCSQHLHSNRPPAIRVGLPHEPHLRPQARADCGFITTTNRRLCK